VDRLEKHYRVECGVANVLNVETMVASGTILISVHLDITLAARIRSTIPRIIQSSTT
jgi:hypothetical protein